MVVIHAAMRTVSWREPMLRHKYGAGRHGEEKDGQDRLMQMMVLMGQNDRSQHQGAELAGHRQSEDMRPKLVSRSPLSRKIGRSIPNAVVGRMRAIRRGECRIPIDVRKLAKSTLRAKAASHASAPRRSGPVPISSGLNSNPAWKSRRSNRTRPKTRWRPGLSRGRKRWGRSGFHTAVPEPPRGCGRMPAGV